MGGTSTSRGLTVADLQSQREARASVNHDTYKQLLLLVQDRIRLRSSNDFRDLVWQVPPLVPGRPVFAAKHAARYISEKLRRGGFEVALAAPREDMYVLYITWQPVKNRRAAPSQKPQSPPSRGGQPSSPSPASGLPVSVAEATQRLEKLKARLRL